MYVWQNAYIFVVFEVFSFQSNPFSGVFIRIYYAMQRFSFILKTLGKFRKKTFKNYKKRHENKTNVKE